MNLQQITREKRTFMLQTGELRQELKKNEAYIDEQRENFSTRLNQMEQVAMDYHTKLNGFYKECSASLSEQQNQSTSSKKDTEQYETQIADLEKWLSS